jgi:hypothetical protein
MPTENPERLTYNIVITPHRVLSLLTLINQLSRANRGDLLSLLQPSAISEKPEIARDVYAAANSNRLIHEDESRERIANIAIPNEALLDMDKFRAYLQNELLDVTDEAEYHYVLSLFAAWIAVQNEQVLETTKLEWEQRFNAQLYPGREERVVNEHPGITSWMEWADFLGWGWQLKFGQLQSKFVPDCTGRLQPLLAELLPEADFIPFGLFMERLSARCPELDGGVLFERCWEACRRQERRGNRLSLMLSTALRVLNQNGSVALEDRADAPDNWTLYPAQSYNTRVTHIRRGAS